MVATRTSIRNELVWRDSSLYTVSISREELEILARGETDIDLCNTAKAICKEISNQLYSYANKGHLC